MQVLQTTQSQIQVSQSQCKVNTKQIHFLGGEFLAEDLRDGLGSILVDLQLVEAAGALLQRDFRFPATQLCYDW